MLPKNKKTKIMVFGTFDGLHPGHLNFFKQARELSTEPFLIVSVARDKNVFKIKGRPPRLGEAERAALVRDLVFPDPKGRGKRDKKSLPLGSGKKSAILVDKVVLSGLKDHLPHIIKERPDIIALGYDQEAYVQNLQEDLNRAGVEIKIVRLLPFKETVYKNKLLHGVIPPPSGPGITTP